MRGCRLQSRTGVPRASATPPPPQLRLSRCCLYSGGGSRGESPDVCLLSVVVGARKFPPARLHQLTDRPCTSHSVVPAKNRSPVSPLLKLSAFAPDPPSRI